MKSTPLTDKAKRLRAWLSHNLRYVAEWQLLDDEIFRLERDGAGDDRGGDELLLMDAYQRRDTAKDAAKAYRETLAEMISAADFGTGYTPVTWSNLKRYVYLRYYRGLPLQRKGQICTVAEKMDLSVSMLTTLDRIALNRLADVWDEPEK